VAAQDSDPASVTAKALVMAWATVSAMAMASAKELVSGLVPVPEPDSQWVPGFESKWDSVWALSASSMNRTTSLVQRVRRQQCNVS